MILATFIQPTLGPEGRSGPRLRVEPHSPPTRPLIDAGLGDRIVRLARLAAEEHARRLGAGGGHGAVEART